MKLVSLKYTQRQASALWEFIEANLPPSLCVRKRFETIQYDYGSEIRPGSVHWNVERAGFLRSVFGDSNPIAEVWIDEVVIFNPSYLSDFQDAVRKYEAATGRDVTIKVWESPKDAKAVEEDATQRMRTEKWLKLSR